MADNQNTPAQSVSIEQYNALLDKVTALEKMLTAKTEINTAKEDLPKIPAEPIVFNKKKYKWNVAAFVNPLSNQKITAEEASTDEDVLNAVLAVAGQGLLTEVK